MLRLSKTPCIILESRYTVNHERNTSLPQPNPRYDIRPGRRVFDRAFRYLRGLCLVERIDEVLILAYARSCNVMHIHLVDIRQAGMSPSPEEAPAAGQATAGAEGSTFTTCWASWWDTSESD